MEGLQVTTLSDMQTALRGAITDVLSEAWYYRLLTSGPATETRTYGSWIAVQALGTGQTTAQEYDDRRQVFRRRETIFAMISDAVAVLNQGDQFKDASGIIWHIDGIASRAHGFGTINYQASRDIPLQASPNRDGGV